MKKEDYRLWLSERVSTQMRLALVAAIVMTVGGLIAFFLEAYLVKSITKIGFVGNNFLAWTITLGILGTVLFFTWLRIPKNLSDREYLMESDGEESQLFVAPAMGVVWTFALGSIDSDQTWVERLLGMLALPQRLLCAAWYVVQRVKQLKEINIPGCAHIIRLVSRKAERMEVSEIAEKRSDPDLNKTLREVSLIDGVVFLTRKTVGVSLAPRLVEELDKWSARRGLGDDDDSP